jgi:hypothetical protein
VKIRHTIAAVAAAIGLAAVPAIANADHGHPTATYRVTVENIATGFQPLSPSGVVVHSRWTDVWNTGSPATAAVAAVAEDANLGVFVDTYTQVRGVSEALIGGGGPIGPMESYSFEIDAGRGDRLSLVSMLVNTNDGFTGLDSVKLGRRTQVFEVGAYDAGTEVNDELAAHIPGPVGNSPFQRAPEGGVIMHHPGVQGGADLVPGVHGWEGPVARITIERVG